MNSTNFKHQLFSWKNVVRPFLIFLSIHDTFLFISIHTVSIYLKLRCYINHSLLLMSKGKQLEILCYDWGGEVRFSYTEDTMADERDTHLWKKASFLMESDHAKLVEIPIGHQVSHYKIFTETSLSPFANGVFLPSSLPSFNFFLLTMHFYL